MISGRKILFFYPHNFFEMNAGTHQRVYQLIMFLAEQGAQVDLFSLDGFTNNWPESDQKRYTFGGIHIFPWDPDIGKRNRPQPGSERRLADFTSKEMRRDFRLLFDSDRYDFVVITYVFWSRLIVDIPGAIKVINLHDFITLTEHQRSGNCGFQLGRMFQSEIQAIDRFDYALTISDEETLHLEPFCSHAKFVKIPIYFPERFSEESEFKYDLLFVGSDNPFNVQGMKWFFSEVHPLLPSQTKMAIVGSISKKIEDRPGLTRIAYVNDLQEIYKKSKIAICPFFGGTSLKVKVVEALSFGKPIVATRWGLVGIVEKHGKGCLVADEAPAFANAISALLRDGVLYANCQEAAKAFFQKCFSKRIFSQRMKKVFGNDNVR